MNNSVTGTAVPQECEGSFLTRAAFAVGVGLLMVAPALPHSERWAAFGIALIAVSWLY